MLIRDFKSSIKYMSLSDNDILNAINDIAKEEKIDLNEITVGQLSQIIKMFDLNKKQVVDFINQ